jgi:uncharacterized protein YecE (DUF72 family)
MATIRVGIGGWDFAEWRGSFYPKGMPRAQELGYASARLTAIEINGTFYRHQSPESFGAWREATPEGFMFSVKAHRATTHSRDFGANAQSIAHFLDSGLAELSEKLGPIFWQFPHTRKFDAALCGAFLDSLPKKLGKLPLRHAIEARHPSFEDPAWTALLQAHNVAMVMVESDKQTLRTEVTADFIYARLQHNAADEPEGYATNSLDAWAKKLKAWSKTKDCFAFFISGDKARAPDSAMAMLKRLK